MTGLTDTKRCTHYPGAYTFFLYSFFSSPVATMALPLYAGAWPRFGFEPLFGVYPLEPPVLFLEFFQSCQHADVHAAKTATNGRIAAEPGKLCRYGFICPGSTHTIRQLEFVSGCNSHTVSLVTSVRYIGRAVVSVERYFNLKRQSWGIYQCK